MFGFESPDEMVGLDPMNHIPEEDRARMAGIMAGYFVEGGTQKTMEVRAIARDGRELWVLGSGVRTHYEGRLAGIIFVKDITAQKAAQKALAEAEEQQRQILNNANDSIVVVQDGKIVFANRRTLELGAFSEEDIRGQSFMDFLCPEDREMMMKRYLKRVGGKEYPSSFQFKGIGKDGVVRWVEIRETSFAWEGKPAHLCLLNDITERKKAAEELAASERRYRLLADNVSDVIWVTDLQWKPTYFNPSVTRLLGYSVEEAVAGAVRMTHSSLQVAMKSFQGALAREEQQPGSASGSPMMELEFIHKNGSAVWAETTVSLLRDSKGHPYAVLGILHDVSERRKAGEALRKSEERFRALIEDSSDVISIVDASGRILYESPSAERVIGYRIEDLVGKGLRDLLESGSVNRSDIDSALSVFETLLSKPGATASNEIRFRHKDGSWHVVEGSARNLLDDPRVGGIVMNYRDITERRRAEDDVKRSEERFRALIENASDAIVVVNADGQIVY
jgi:PAS domain S-box-containing protein